MASRKHTPEQIEFYRAKISELHLQRYTQSEIAKILGLSQAMVSWYHRKNQEDLKKHRLTDPIVAREEQLAALDLIERGLWAAVDTGLKRRPAGIELQIKNDGAISRNRQSLLKCQQIRAKLLGLDDTSSVWAPASDVDHAHQDLDELTQTLVNILNRSTPSDVETAPASVSPQSTRTLKTTPKTSCSKNTGPAKTAPKGSAGKGRSPKKRTSESTGAKTPCDDTGNPLRVDLADAGGSKPVTAEAGIKPQLRPKPIKKKPQALS